MKILLAFALMLFCCSGFAQNKRAPKKKPEIVVQPVAANTNSNKVKTDQCRAMGLSFNLTDTLWYHANVVRSNKQCGTIKMEGVGRTFRERCNTARCTACKRTWRED